MSATYLRIGHCSPNTPAVDVWVGDERLVTDVEYEAVVDYVELDAGRQSFAVTPVGKGRPDALCAANLQLRADRAYTLLAVGEFDDIVPMLVEDARPGEEIPADECRVRLLHCSPTTPAVDVAVRGSPVLFEDVAFEDETPYWRVEAGSYDVEVRDAGSDDVRLELLDVQFPGGTARTLFAVGMADDLDLLTRDDAAPSTPSDDGYAAVR